MPKAELPSPGAIADDVKLSLRSDTNAGDFSGFQRYKEIQEQAGILVDTRESGTVRTRARDNWNYWNSKFKQGKISLDALSRIPQALFDLETAASPFIEEFRRYPRYTYIHSELETTIYPHPIFPHIDSLFEHKTLTSSPTAIAMLLMEGILPTEALINLVNEDPENGLQQIQILAQKTADGDFDPKNTVQRDLEYLKYLRSLKEPFKDDHFSEFVSLQFSGEDGTELLPYEIIEARAAAFEAANVYWMINEGVNRGREAIVVGNQRYGSHFVTEPLRWHLQKLRGTSLIDARVPSTTSGPTTIIDNLFSQHTINRVIDGKSDVWIVDGTRNSVAKNRPRFPNSMYGFLNWLLAYNEAARYQDPRFEEHVRKLRTQDAFASLVDHLREKKPQTPLNIRMWAPIADEDTKTATIGSTVFPYSEADFHEDLPQAILVNPVLPGDTLWLPKEFRQHKGGYFDDPDSHVRKRGDYVFTPFGLEQRINGNTEKQFVHQVQRTMEGNMEEMLRLAFSVRRI